MDAEYDFIVVGSGAGGGPLACNLALSEHGYRVALVEAGGDPAREPGSRPFFHYSVPGLHARATEDPAMSWEFFVEHYSDVKRQQRDSKYHRSEQAAGRGIFYPRAAAVGGCTSHHAMITVTPHNQDWEDLAALTGDPSWSAARMRDYFERLEACQYLPRPAAAHSRDPATRHGFDGWLPTSMPDLTLALDDPLLSQLLYRSFLLAYHDAQPPAEAGQPSPTERALVAAVGQLLQAGQRAARRQPASVRPTFNQLKRGAERKQAQIRAEYKGDDEALLEQYLNADELLKLFRLAYAWLDPNRWFADDRDRVGPYSPPASVLHGVRTGVRERILAVRALYPDRLHLLTDALVTEVILEPAEKKAGAPAWAARGVRYVEQTHGKLYRAATPPEEWAKVLPRAKTLRLRGSGEVILAGGAFNTPQLLMLSGVGPRAELEKHGIRVRCDLPGVGRNLQDRYEVTVVSELPKGRQFEALDGLTFRAPDDLSAADRGMQEWANHRGVYATNGVVLTIIKRSKVAAAANEPPDLFLFGLPGNFRGYKKGYSGEVQREQVGGKWVDNHRRFTWVILKGRSRNRQAGSVTLRSKHPLHRPVINFNYFDNSEENRKGPGWKEDIAALTEGVRFAQLLTRRSGLNARVIWPGPRDLGDAALAEFIQREAWGHHACGTCRIGKADDRLAVLDGDFRVRGVRSLRVVDASVFPRIPGFFIVASIYMISEKASDVILRDRRADDEGGKPWPGPVLG